MKYLMNLIAATALASVMPVTPAFAQASGQGATGIVDFCKYDVPTNHPSLKVGNCVGSRTTYYVSTDNGWPQHVCFFIQSEQPDDFYAVYDTYQECVIDKASALIG